MKLHDNNCVYAWSNPVDIEKVVMRFSLKLRHLNPDAYGELCLYALCLNCPYNLII